MSTQSVQLAEILQLSVAERSQLVEDIWDSIVQMPEAVPLTNEQKEELDRRLESYRANPDEGISWNLFKKAAQT
jgi:putative addiction module component (TIGR02574 family)